MTEITLTRHSTLHALHNVVWETNSPSSIGAQAHKEAGMAIRSASRIIVDVCRRFEMDLDFIDIDGLPLPSTFSVYQTALLHIRFSGNEFLQPDWTFDMNHLKSALGHFSNRWAIGGMVQVPFKHYKALLIFAIEVYLQQIDVAISNEKQRRTSQGI